jgi:hypothetical protein
VISEIWTRNSFDVEAVRVTEENIREVANWCGGTVAKSLTDYPKLYVCLDTVHYNKHRQTKAFVGDWIIHVDDEFKHYRDKSFRLAYQSKAAKREAVLEMVREALGITNGTLDPYAEMSVEVENLADKIIEFFGEV